MKVSYIENNNNLILLSLDDEKHLTSNVYTYENNENNLGYQSMNNNLEFNLLHHDQHNHQSHHHLQQFNLYQQDNPYNNIIQLRSNLILDDNDEEFANMTYHENVDKYYHDNMDKLYHRSMDKPYHEDADKPYHEEVDKPYHKDVIKLFHEDVDKAYQEDVDKPFNENVLPNPFLRPQRELFETYMNSLNAHKHHYKEDHLMNPFLLPKKPYEQKHSHYHHNFDFESDKIDNNSASNPEDLFDKPQNIGFDGNPSPLSPQDLPNHNLNQPNNPNHHSFQYTIAHHHHQSVPIVVVNPLENNNAKLHSTETQNLNETSPKTNKNSPEDIQDLANFPDKSCPKNGKFINQGPKLKQLNPIKKRKLNNAKEKAVNEVKEAKSTNSKKNQDSNFLKFKIYKSPAHLQSNRENPSEIKQDQALENTLRTHIEKGLQIAPDVQDKITDTSSSDSSLSSASSSNLTSIESSLSLSPLPSVTTTANTMTMISSLLNREMINFDRPSNLNSNIRSVSHEGNTDVQADEGIINFAKLKKELEEFLNSSNMLNKIYSPTQQKIGTLTLEQRRNKIEKYLQKRKKKTWNKRINYDCRKKVADTRLRIKGRFVTKEQAIGILEKDGINDLENTTIDDIKDLLNLKYGTTSIIKPKKGHISNEDHDDDNDNGNSNSDSDSDNSNSNNYSSIENDHNAYNNFKRSNKENRKKKTGKVQDKNIE